MRICNEEINALQKEIDPWMKRGILEKDAPEEIVEKYNRIHEIMDEEEERLIGMM